MKTLKNAVLLLAMIFTTIPSAFRLPANDNQPSGYDLAAAVNAYREANGYYQLNPHSLVMAAAQAHADWIVETGQGGHIGAGGSDETMRVSWTGYGGGVTILCDENWASGSTIDDAMYGAWSDWTHQEVMLNTWGNRYTDIGGGVASLGNGRYVFVLNVCLVVGQEYSGEAPGSHTSTAAGSHTSTAAGSNSSAPPANSSVLGTADSSNYIYGVTLATPLADGTIKHKVLYGQTLASIAKAYSITIETLRALNEMAADETIIWPDEELLIQPAGTGANSAQGPATPETDASPAPSATAAMQTQTQQPTLTVSTTSPTATPQAAPNDGQRNSTAGIVVLGLAGVGLAVSLYYSSIKKE